VRDPWSSPAPRARIDPFARIRRAIRSRACAYSITSPKFAVQARLATYSSIEPNSSSADVRARDDVTAARVRTPHRVSEGRQDRSFFKAAYRVFMASDRGRIARSRTPLLARLLSLRTGNYTPPRCPKFARWYASGDPAPPSCSRGPPWEAYAERVKHAEDEATFFSFWTLYNEHLPLARHVGKLTFFEAMRDLAITIAPRSGRCISRSSTTRRIPDENLESCGVCGARRHFANLMEYMRGFRDYSSAISAPRGSMQSRRPYRSYAIRFGIYGATSRATSSTSRRSSRASRACRRA